ncbi:hypothetical protein ACFL43_04150 [Thermodesulfobacteriota bacterium]
MKEEDPPVKKKKEKLPKRNDFRIVWGDHSYIHPQPREIKRIIEIIKYLKDKKKPVSMKQMIKDLKVKKTALSSTLRTMAGAVCFEQLKDGTYRRLCGKLIDLKQGRFNPKSDFVKAPSFLKAPYYVRRAVI